MNFSDLQKLTIAEIRNLPSFQSFVVSGHNRPEDYVDSCQPPRPCMVIWFDTLGHLNFWRTQLDGTVTKTTWSIVAPDMVRVYDLDDEYMYEQQHAHR